MRLSALLSALLVAALWANPQGIAYLCSMSGERGPTCCCGPETPDPDRIEAELERRDCCVAERTQSSVPAATADVTEDQAPQIAGLAPKPTTEVESVPRLVHLVAALARGPPQAIGPPPYLRNRSLLI